MKILHVSDVYLPKLGGIEVLVHDLSHEQADRGWQPTILTRQAPDPADRAPTGSSRVPVVRDPRRVDELLATAEVVHVHLSLTSPLGWRTAARAARAGIPTVATVHSMWNGVWPLVRALAVASGVDQLPIQWAAVSAQAAVPVELALRPAYGVMVLPNAIDVAAWRIPARKTRPDQPIVLVSTQRMAPRKRPLALVDLLADVRSRVPSSIELAAVLVGDGPLLNQTKRRVSRRGLESWVTLPGRLGHRELRLLYGGADIFVAPASLESFGIAGLEARTAGLAVAGLRGTGLDEFVQPGVSGALAADDRELADQLVTWCTERARLTAITEHNRAIEPQHDWSFALQRCQAAYVAAGLTSQPSSARVA